MVIVVPYLIKIPFSVDYTRKQKHTNMLNYSMRFKRQGICFIEKEGNPMYSHMRVRDRWYSFRKHV